MLTREEWKQLAAMGQNEPLPLCWSLASQCYADPSVVLPQHRIAFANTAELIEWKRQQTVSIPPVSPELAERILADVSAGVVELWYEGEYLRALARGDRIAAARSVFYYHK